MRKTKLITALSLSFAVTSLLAKPVEIETKDAHIVVVRTIDGYGNGDTLQDEGLLEFHASKRYAFSVEASADPAINKTDRITYLDSSAISEAIKIKGLETGFIPNSPAKTDIFKLSTVYAPITLTPTQANQFTDIQNKLWGQEIRNMGDPSTLAKRHQEDKESNHWGELGRGALGAVLGAVGGNYLGNTVWASAGGLINAGSGATIGMVLGLSPEESKLNLSNKGLAVFAQLPKVDYTKYKSVDIRKVTYLGQFARYGDIIIAYKGEKTSQAEQDALIAAIPVLLGFNESVEQVKTARAQDLEARQKVWSEYIAEQAVKKE